MTEYHCVHEKMKLFLKRKRSPYLGTKKKTKKKTLSEGFCSLFKVIKRFFCDVSPAKIYFSKNDNESQDHKLGSMKEHDQHLVQTLKMKNNHETDSNLSKIVGCIKA